VYPLVTLLTPLTCSNTASTPQKQPPAKTAVCSPFAVIGGVEKQPAGYYSAIVRLGGDAFNGSIDSTAGNAASNALPKETEPEEISKSKLT
jgi:hypothetical protein